MFLKNVEEGLDDGYNIIGVRDIFNLGDKKYKSDDDIF